MDYDTFCWQSEVDSVQRFLEPYTPEERLKFLAEVCPEFLSNPETVKRQADRIRDLHSQCVALQRQVDAMAKIDSLYASLNTVRCVLKLGCVTGDQLSALKGLLPRIDEVLKAVETAAGHHS